MGVCASELADSVMISRDIDKRNEKSHKEQKCIAKLLLLGAGESGKSTLFKQIMQSFGNPLQEEDRLAYRRAVHSNTVMSMGKLADACVNELRPENQDAGELVRSMISNSDSPGLGIDTDLEGELAEALRILWADPAVQEVYKKREKLQLADNIDHFFNNIDRLADPEYIPSYDDIIRSRVRTTGIVESELRIESHIFRIIDVGGQRNERTKWIHCFEEVTGVMFVAALSEYDQVLFEQDTVNRMDEALSLFGEIANSRWFQETSMILFLNKRDLFEKKLKTVPLTVWDPDFSGNPHDYDECTNYLIAAFESRNRSHQEVYSHVCCALDQELVQHLFISVKDIIIRTTLRELQLD